MSHLRVTHILNVTDLIPNHFEASHSIKVEYLKINIEDQNSVQIKMSFPIVYNFIDSAFLEGGVFYKSLARSNSFVNDIY